MLSHILSLFNIRDGVIAMDPAELTGSPDMTDEKEVRIARLEKVTEIQGKIIEEMIDSTIKSLKALQVISRGFDLASQKDLALELEELEKAENYLLRQALAKPR